LLETYEYSLLRIPQSFELRFEAERLETVEPRANEPRELRYYATFTTDANADGCFDCAVTLRFWVVEFRDSRSGA
jgi:hypothetical protein